MNPYVSETAPIRVGGYFQLAVERGQTHDSLTGFRLKL